MDLQSILEACSLPSARYSRVTGGDINDAFLLTGAEGKFFLKVNDAIRFPGMFQREKNGLEVLSPFVNVPKVLRCDVADGMQYLLLEWIETGVPTSNFWKALGHSLAHLHLKEQNTFGWTENNYIGSLVQHNDGCNTWQEFFVQYRVSPLAKLLRDSGKYSAADVLITEKFCHKIDRLFPTERPSLLHGDLWVGNIMADYQDKPFLIDPAVYCGHREIDVCMTKLFGGFDDEFYDAYHEVYPLEKDWQRRLPISQLYPLLVHAVLFGAGYVDQTRRILRGEWE